MRALIFLATPLAQRANLGMISIAYAKGGLAELTRMILQARSDHIGLNVEVRWTPAVHYLAVSLLTCSSTGSSSSGSGRRV